MRSKLQLKQNDFDKRYHSKINESACLIEKTDDDEEERK